MDILIYFLLFTFAGFLFLVLKDLNWKKYFNKPIDPILKEKRQIKLKEQYSQIEKEFNDKATSTNRSNNESSDRSNSTCPKCKSTNVNNRIKRVQGKIDGEVEGSSFLFSGSLYGSVHGELDTNEVNKCNSCQHEWKVSKSSYKWGGDLMEDSCRTVFYFFSNINDAKNTKFDKNDLSEKFNSLEEKRAHFLSEALNLNSWRAKEIKSVWEKYSIELFEYIFENKASSFHKENFQKYYDPTLLEQMGMKHIDEFLN